MSYLSSTFSHSLFKSSVEDQSPITQAERKRISALIEQKAHLNTRGLKLYDPERDGPLHDEEHDLYCLPYKRFYGNAKAVLSMSDFCAIKDTMVTQMMIIRRNIPGWANIKHYVVRYTLKSQVDESKFFVYGHILQFGYVFYIRSKEDQDLEYLLGED